MNDIDQVLVSLKRLGKSPDDIAASLRAMGVRGKNTQLQLYAGIRCPLEAYLDAEGFDVWHVGSNVLYTRPNTKNGEAAALPPACVEFVKRFDRGQYPDLCSVSGKCESHREKEAHQDVDS